MKASGSEEKAIMYVETTINRSRKLKCPLETGAGLSAYQHERRTYLDEIDTAASSTSSVKEGSATSKLLKEIALLYFVYGPDLRQLVEEHKLCIKENLCGKVDCVLADLLYSVRRDQKDDHAEYYVISSSNMKTCDEVGRNPTIVLLYLLFDLWYNASASEKRRASQYQKTFLAKAVLKTRSATV